MSPTHITLKAGVSMMNLKGLESTQEARITIGCLLSKAHMYHILKIHAKAQISIFEF